MRLQLPLLDEDPEAPFPPANSALVDPDGLLAIGGDLSPARLLNAYRHGIFPWFSEGQPILWWCPDPRTVFQTDQVRFSSRFRRTLRGKRWMARADTAFDQVLDACASTPRPGQRGTWITAGMREAYVALHRLGIAHSIEVFAGERLVGGVFGLSFGRMFCGDSMYSGESGASSLALAALAMRLREWGWPIIDAQVPNAHTRSLGVETWRRGDYLQVLAGLRDAPAEPGPWSDRFGVIPASGLCARPPD